MIAPESRGRPCSRARAQSPGRHREHLSHGRVELAHALKARGERHACDLHRRRLEQDPRRLRALGARQLERPRTHAGDELAMHMALAVAEPASQSAHTVAIDHAVGDQAHRPTHEVAPPVPLRRPWRRVRATALARSEPGALGGRGSRVEAHVLTLWRARRAARAAVDAGRGDAAEDPAVEARVTGLDRLPAAVGIEQHGPQPCTCARADLAEIGRGHCPRPEPCLLRASNPHSAQCAVGSLGRAPAQLV